MTSYLERYRNGEYQSVWAELGALGDAVRQPPFFAEALAVARETMGRVRQNIETLHQRLLDLDFRFLDPSRAYRPPSTSIYALLARFEAQFGMLPLSIWAWFEIVGGVEFCGDHPALCGYDGAPIPGFPDYRPHNPDTSFPYYADPLLFWDIGGAFRDLEDTSGVPIEPGPIQLLNVPDLVTKAGASGSAYTLRLPNHGMDTLLDHEPRGKTFVEYLRISFRWGGFPGFELHSAPEFEEWRRKHRVRAEYPGIPVPFDLLHQLSAGLLAF